MGILLVERFHDFLSLFMSYGGLGGPSAVGGPNWELQLPIRSSNVYISCHIFYNNAQLVAEARNYQVYTRHYISAGTLDIRGPNRKLQLPIRSSNSRRATQPSAGHK